MIPVTNFCDKEATALLSAMVFAALRSKGRTKVGAVVVHRPSNAMHFGYNGFPPGVLEPSHRWDGPAKHKFVVHAECNALRKAVAAHGLPLTDCVLYSSLRPCANCTKELISCGIREVFWLREDADLLTNADVDASAAMMEETRCQFSLLNVDIAALLTKAMKELSP
jgi:dCMP deaminase